jgi:hypothetical protein
LLIHNSTTNNYNNNKKKTQRNEDGEMSKQTQTNKQTSIQTNKQKIPSLGTTEFQS